jgi:prefoldin subunit 5
MPANVEMPDASAEARLVAVRARIAAYEQCAEAVGVVTASLEELSSKIEAMKASTQQLNAFTRGWLAVWTRGDA